jgi:hypothetical protein
MAESVKTETRKDGEAVNGGITDIMGAAPDLSRYHAHVAHLDLSPERETEMLATVWRIMGSFVDRAFGDDPVQHVNETRTKDEVRYPPVIASDKVQSQTDDVDLSSAFASPAAVRGRKERS